MYKVFLYTTDAEETLTRMQIQIRDVGHQIIPDQLMAWQREDMKRQYPFATMPNFVSAETSIWPRSRTYERVHKKREARVRRFRKPMSALPRITGTFGMGKQFTATSRRPILRPELFDKLCERMEEVLAVNLKWVTSKTEGSQAPTSGPDAKRSERLSMLGPSHYP